MRLLQEVISQNVLIKHKYKHSLRLPLYLEVLLSFGTLQQQVVQVVQLRQLDQQLALQHIMQVQ